MPHKKTANGRHPIPKMRHAAANWAEYEGGLRRRGSLTLWITDEAIAAWARRRRLSADVTPKSPPRRSARAYRCIGSKIGRAHV